MGAFFSALGGDLASAGKALGNYEKQRLQRRGGLAGMAMNAAMNHFQQQGQSPEDPMNQMDKSPVDDSAMMQPTASALPPPSIAAPQAPAPPQAPEPMAGGKLVTKPTTALLGEHGPEMVLPLNNAPGNKVNALMLGGMPRSRYRRLSGPGSMIHSSPVRADLPLRPNQALR